MIIKLSQKRNKIKQLELRDKILTLLREYNEPLLVMYGARVDTSEPLTIDRKMGGVIMNCNLQTNGEGITLG